jgi:hypothetical protein
VPENKIIRNKTAQPFYHGWAVFASTMLLEHLVLTIAFTKDPKLCIYWLVPEVLPPVLLPEPPDSDPPVESPVLSPLVPPLLLPVLPVSVSSSSPGPLEMVRVIVVPSFAVPVTLCLITVLTAAESSRHWRDTVNPAASRRSRAVSKSKP